MLLRFAVGVFGGDGADESVEILFQALHAGFAGVYVSADGLNQPVDGVLSAQLRERNLRQIRFDTFEAFVGLAYFSKRLDFNLFDRHYQPARLRDRRSSKIDYSGSWEPFGNGLI